MLLFSCFYFYVLELSVSLGNFRRKPFKRNGLFLNSTHDEMTCFSGAKVIIKCIDSASERVGFVMFSNSLNIFLFPFEFFIGDSKPVI